MRKQKKKKKNTPITFIVYIILFAILIYSGIKIYKWYKDNKDNSKLEEEINTAVVIQEDKQEEEKYIIDFNSLKEKNDETVAWIAVNNTNVKYPVVKTKNNEVIIKQAGFLQIIETNSTVQIKILLFMGITEEMSLCLEV